MRHRSPGSTRLPADITQAALLELLAQLAADREVHGILVQLPLPAQIDEQTVIAAIPPEKDVDGFTPVNWAGCSSGSTALCPAPPRAVSR